MPAIHIPRRHLIQPQGRLRVRPEWGARVVSLIHFGTGRAIDVADINANYVLTGPGSFSETPQARAFSNDQISTPAYIESSGALAGYSGSPTLCFWFASIGQSQSAQGMLWAIPSASSYTQFTGTQDRMYVLGSGSVVLLNESLTNTVNRSLIIRTAAADPAIFVDHRKNTSVSGSVASGGKTIRIGAWSSHGWQFVGNIGSVAVVADAMSDSEAHELADYPWMFYAADPVRFYSLPSGPITLTSLMMSAFTSSGARATLGIAR